MLNHSHPPGKENQEGLDLEGYLYWYRDFYNSTVLKLANPTAKQKRERYVFAALSVHRQFSQSVKGLHYFREFYEDTRQGRILRDNISHELKEQRTGLYTQAESALWSYYRLRATKKRLTRDLALAQCRGIGIAKISFWFALCNPTGEYLCLDTHMLQWLGIKETKSWKKYLEIETLLGFAAQSIGYYPFAYQWAIWEWKQKKGHIDHSFLWNK